jgi:MFS family permease
LNLQRVGMTSPNSSAADGRTASSAPAARGRAVLGVLCLVVFLGVVENTILNIALPTIQADLGITTRELQWITDAYVLVFAGGVLVAGGIGDRFGRLGALRTGVAIIAVGSAIPPFATSAGQLIALRAVLGLGAALCFPTSLSTLVNVFTERVARVIIAIGISATTLPGRRKDH